jgi:hypothetical protein
VNKNISKICAQVILSLTLFSCSAQKNMPAPEYRRSYDTESSQEINSDERMVAYEVRLGLSVKNTDDTKKTVLEQIKSNKGYIIDENNDRVTARIPSQNMDIFLNNTRILGEKLFEVKKGTDITDQYRDNTASLNSLKKVRDRYFALLEKAEAVNEILSIEKELERVNLEIEKLEGKIKYAEQSVSYSIITVWWQEPAKPVKPGPVGWIFYGLYHGIKWLFVWG